MHRDQGYLLKALEAKADGYLLKDDTHRQLIAAIETIRTGNRFLSPLMTVAEGKSSQEIADLLFISLRTVEHHRASMKKKLKVKNIVDLVKYAVRKGYTSQ